MERRQVAAPPQGPPLTPILTPPHPSAPPPSRTPAPPRRCGLRRRVEPDPPSGRRPVPFSMAAGEGGSRRLTDEGSRGTVRSKPVHRSKLNGQRDPSSDLAALGHLLPQGGRIKPPHPVSSPAAKPVGEDGNPRISDIKPQPFQHPAQRPSARRPRSRRRLHPVWRPPKQERAHD